MTRQPESSDVVRIAVAGAGRIGREHIRAIQRSPRLALAGVADPSEAARAAFASADVAVATDVEGLLAATRVDAVIVAVPSAHHVTLVSRLLERGVPVLCEKPCGLRSADVRDLGARAAELGTPLQIGYWRRFVPSLRELRARIADGSMGELSMVTAIQWDGEPPSAAFRDVASSGGILIDMGVHEFDMLRWLTGQEIVEMTGYASDVNYAEPVPGDPETVNLVARMSGGTTAIVSLARRYPPGDICRVEVLGGEATTQLTFVEPGDDGEMLIDAFQAQAEHLADIARGAQPEGATILDAHAALVAAEQGTATFAASRT
jgi:myo-inositol 2-dehydrogenase / D-chiro-inositol 1-dehydrogenase